MFNYLYCCILLGAEIGFCNNIHYLRNRGILVIKRFTAILGVVILVISFTFIPATIAQDDGELTCSTPGQDLEGDAGTVLSVTCPADCTSGSLWGTDTYTDDSSVCTAAIHAGALDENGGTVDVFILDGQDEYPSSEQNGISSSDWGSWGRSFGFGSSAFALSCDDSTIEGAEPGDTFQVSCPAACDAGSIWGTNVYTDDSTICTAAAHAGVIAQSDGGEFTLAYIGGQEEYPASEQNEISSSDWGSWDLSFTFAQPIACGQTSIEGSESGDAYLASCQAGCDEGSIWGTDIYTDDSDLCTAAAHAGVISLGEGGTFIIIYSDGQEEYPASEQYGIESYDWGSWDSSFSISPVGGTSLECGTAANSIEADVGTSLIVSCPAACNASSVWGTDVYTDDSSICSAAAHAGVISLDDGGSFVLTIEEGLDDHPGSEQNGISTSDWGSWERSFSVSN